MIIYSIANQKGGVGKTTTAQALIEGLAERGYKVLGIDLDGQRNLTTGTGADKSKPNIMDALTGKATAPEVIQHLQSGDIMPASKNLAGADAIITSTGKEYRLKELLATLAGQYDYCIIDTPPALGILTINALTASNSVIIPIQADLYSLEGTDQLATTLEPVKKYCNPELKVAGLLLTRYNARTILSREVAEVAGALAKRLGSSLFKTTIRETIKVKEAQLSQRGVLSYDPKAKVAEDYRAFIQELLEREATSGRV